MRRDAIRSIALGFGTALIITFASAGFAANLSVENNGVDSATCGAPAHPCRSITQAIANADPRDHILVGPGRYLGETGAPGCGCFLAINKPLVITSTDGAASTVIDSRESVVQTSVLIIADDTEFGRSGLGFTVTNPKKDGGFGIAIDGRNVKVRGNQVIGDLLLAAPGVGIETITTNPGPMLIEANQVMVWNRGIEALGAGTTVHRNQVSLNGIGINVGGTSIASGNVAVANGAAGVNAFEGASVVGNALLGSDGAGVQANDPFSGTITHNNLVGNSLHNVLNCGLSNVGVVGLVVPGNYWGARTGPGPDPADGICNVRGGTTTATPFSLAPFNVRAPIRP